MNTPEYTSFLDLAAASIRRWGSDEFRLQGWDAEESEDEQYDQAFRPAFREFYLHLAPHLTCEVTRYLVLRQLVIDLVGVARPVLDEDRYPTVSAVMYRVIEFIDRGLYMYDPVTMGFWDEAGDVATEIAHEWSELV